MDIDLDDILQEFDTGAGAAAPTAGADITTLTQSWIAERTSPEILPFQTLPLERLTDRIRLQIELVEAETGNLDPTSNFRLILIQTELERVKYLVRAYLRVRMHKIDKYALHILTTASLHPLLAASEMQYLKSHLALLNTHYLSSFLRNFPEQLRRLDDHAAGGSNMIDVPDLESAVFCRVLRDVEEEIEFPGTDTENFKISRGDILVVRYSAVREFVMRGDVELI